MIFRSIAEDIILSFQFKIDILYNTLYIWYNINIVSKYLSANLVATINKGKQDHERYFH